MKIAVTLVMTLALLGCAGGRATRGSEHGALRGLRVGMMVGGVVGTASGIGIGVVANRECESEPAGDRDCLAPLVLGPVLFAGAGVLVGAAVGAVIGAIADPR